MPLQFKQRARSALRTALIVSIVLAAAVWGLSSVSSCNGEVLVSGLNQARGDPYPLDDIERTVEAEDGGDGGIACPEVELLTVAGDTLRYSPPVKVVAPFAERLRRFEAVVIDVAVRHYGRGPRAIVNDGAYLCRPVRHRTYRLSEHALGNAIDVVGFDFGPLEKTPDAGLLTLPPALQAKFRVRVENHWRAQTGESAIVHARFLDELTRVVAEQKVFRSVLGPSHPTHRTHFHFDMAPWSHVMP
jgi:hypothetical protein